MKHKFYKIILFLIASVFIPHFVFGAEISFDAKTQEISANQQFDAKVFINTDNEYINAIEGKIIFPQDLLEVKNINDGNSIINLWVEKPKNTGEGQITFAGIIPGGYNNSQGLILSITFLAKKEGSGTVEFNDMQTLLNDGKGTKTNATISNLQFTISQQNLVSEKISAIKIEDKKPPETFTPQIASNTAIFDGKWFLVFATEDKGSGVDYYEVQEGNRPPVIAESPYLLQNQNLDEKISVKAVDKSGNERIAIVPSPKISTWYYLFAIIIGAMFIYFIYKFLCKRRNMK